jgi:hypothetical protein
MIIAYPVGSKPKVRQAASSTFRENMVRSGYGEIELLPTKDDWGRVHLVDPLADACLEFV